MLTVDQIRAVDREIRSKVQAVEVKEWNNTTVYVRRITASERDAFGVEYEASKAGNRPFRGWLAALCLCDEKGNQLFHVAQAEELGNMDGGAIDRINQAAMEFNGLTEKAMDDAEKNSATTKSP